MMRVDHDERRSQHRPMRKRERERVSEGEEARMGETI
jgi:hypothetical protein